MQSRYLKAISIGREDIFYKSWSWRQKRKQILQRDNFECQRCKSQGRMSKATTVHHKKELKERPDLGMDQDNLTSVCFACHNEIHERFGGAISEPRIDIPEKW